MIDSSDEYNRAIVKRARKIEVKATVDISDPDLSYKNVASSPPAPWSKVEEIHDKDFTDPSRYATFELGRWLLDGSFRIFPDTYKVSDPIGYCGNAVSADDGTFTTPQFVDLKFSGVSTLQACSIWFSADPLDGVPSDFTVDIIVNGVSFYTKKYEKNRKSSVSITGFSVFTPDTIRLTVTQWSLPGRRMRVVEIVPGVYEQWTGNQIKSLNIQQNGDFSCLTLPYGSCDLSIDNKDRQFDPRSKTGIFQSLEERQSVDVSIGARLENGSVEYKRVGVFYQFSDGWKTSNNGMVMNWSLVDIVGLLANREFIPPAILPTTLGGWISAFVSQLGDNFKPRYHVDPAYANKPVTASKDAVTGQKVGELLRYACMAAGTWPRADADTGYLTAEPLWNQGNKITLDNIVNYPTLKANISIAALIFTLADGNDTQYVVSGNSTTSEQTVGIQNPFIHTREEALTAARLILSNYGGNIMETTGRGNPSSEIGDVDTVWLNETNATTGRRSAQSFEMENSVLRGCKSRLIQADGSYLYQDFAVIRESGKWKVPPGVKKIRLVIGSGGQGGGKGQKGQWKPAGSSNIQFSGYLPSPGAPGVDGIGGKVWYGVVDVNPEQEFDVVLGEGGAPSIEYGVPGGPGGVTTFGVYSSANGKEYPYGYTDISNGQSFCRTGVPVPADGTGDGGAGGAGGAPGEGYLRWIPGLVSGGHNEWITTKEPEDGQPGAMGASGFVMVTWDKEASREWTSN